MEGSFSSESITYKSFPRLGHLVLHVDEVQVVVDAAAKVAVLGAYYLQIRTSVWAPSPACRRSPGGGGRRCQGSCSSEFFLFFFLLAFLRSLLPTNPPVDWAPGPACRRRSGGGGRRCQGCSFWSLLPTHPPLGWGTWEHGTCNHTYICHIHTCVRNRCNFNVYADYTVHCVCTPRFGIPTSYIRARVIKQHNTNSQLKTQYNHTIKIRAITKPINKSHTTCGQSQVLTYAPSMLQTREIRTSAHPQHVITTENPAPTRPQTQVASNTECWCMLSLTTYTTMAVLVYVVTVNIHQHCQN